MRFRLTPRGAALVVAAALSASSSVAAGAATTTTDDPSVPAPAPTYTGCGKTLTREEGAKRWLADCARAAKDKVNAVRRKALLPPIRPRRAFAHRTPWVLAHVAIPNWKGRKLERNRARLREFREWRRNDPYGYVVRYGLSRGEVENFTCIHGHEGAWDDPDPPYWGGIQMDMNFMTTYGYFKGPLPTGERLHASKPGSFVRLWGTADHWPVWAQFVAGHNALVAGRGYYPWPTTARYCGII